MVNVIVTLVTAWYTALFLLVPRAARAELGFQGHDLSNFQVRLPYLLWSTKATKYLARTSDASRPSS